MKCTTCKGYGHLNPDNTTNTRDYGKYCTVCDGTGEVQNETPYNPEQAFWDAISKDLADDTPRLIYADWLDENGEEEIAKYVRLWVRLRNEKRNNTHITQLFRTFKELAWTLQREGAEARFPVALFQPAGISIRPLFKGKQ